MSEITIFQLLNEIEKQNFALYDTLTKEQRNVLFKPIVVYMWLISSAKMDQYIFLDEFVNPYVFILHKHPKLLYFLMCVCGDKNIKKFTFHKRNVKKESRKETLNVIEQYYECSPRESSSYMNLLNKDDVIEMAGFLGYEKNQLSAISKEWKDG